MGGRYVRKDHLYQQAKEEGYRSRAAYKLLELDKKYRLLKSGQKVLDLGCFPGGWLQVALAKVGERGKVLGVDLRQVEPLAIKGMSAVLLRGDVSQEETQQKLKHLAGGEFDLILSDLSPQLSGIKFRDAARSAELSELALHVAGNMLKQGGSLVAKTFPGAECDELSLSYQQSFKKFSRVVLSSSRKSSNEMYFFARGFIRQVRTHDLEEDKQD